MSEKKYILTESELLKLLEKSCKLDALDQGGVGNWSWYEESISNYLENRKAEEIEEVAEFCLRGYGN